ncbi:MAG: type IV secretory system conjugative DNA transfer family protein [Patescibacteria group bacterium]
MHDENKVVYFAATDSRGKRQPFGIKMKDRSRHVYVIGKTGMGKSTLLENMAIQDIQNGEGLAFVDPHGKTADLLLEYIPESRLKDVIYFAPFDTDYPISFNVMEDVGIDKRHLVANGLMSAFKKIWIDAWSARMEYILNNILLALLEYPESTLIGVNRMLADKDYRNKVVANISDPSVKAFWKDEFAKYGDRYMQEAGAAIQNKIGQFIANPLVRNIIGQPKSTFDMRKVMDERKILIINLSKGRVGEANANLLGSMLVTKIYLGAMSRADVPDAKMRNVPPFYLFVDEFQSFANESFADILSEARKYKLSLTIAHQYIEQMSEEVRAAVFGNVGTMIMFRVGAYDAEVLEKEFAPQFTPEDLVNLGFTQIYLKLMIDGVTSPPFSATTLPPIEKKTLSPMDRIIDLSRRTYARPRSIVEEEIRKWHEPIIPTQVKAREENRWSEKERRRFPRPLTHSSSAPTPSPVLSSSVNPPAKNPFAAITFNQRGTMQTPQEKAFPRTVQEKETLPLSTLSYKDKDRRKENKGATPESLASLKHVLSEVLKEPPPKPSLPPQTPKVSPVQVKKTETPPSPPFVPPTPKVNSPREIPETELKKILETDA